MWCCVYHDHFTKSYGHGTLDLLNNWRFQMFGKRKIAAIVAEFLGTGILTLLVLSVQRSTIGVAFFVAIAAGLTLAVLMFAIGSVSGAHVNPAITIAMWTARKVSTITAIVYVAVQLLGAWAAYYLYTYFVNNKLQPVGGHFSGRILVAEAVGTGIFALGWASTVYQGYSKATSAAIAGTAYIVGLIGASAASIGLINPALALGVRAWVWGTYILGPVLGAIIGMNLYGLLFASPESLLATETVSVDVASLSVVPAEAVIADAPATVRKPRATRGRPPKATAATPRRTTTARKTTTTRRTTTTRKPRSRS
jgi:glycerol uptake facilitator-like aquaporin